jgi:ABC-type Na+ efflux pump permease subunit
MSLRNNPAPFLLPALAFVTLGATGRRVFTFVGLAFLAAYAVLALRARR